MPKTVKEVLETHKDWVTAKDFAELVGFSLANFNYHIKKENDQNILNYVHKVEGRNYVELSAIDHIDTLWDRRVPIDEFKKDNKIRAPRKSKEYEKLKKEYDALLTEYNYYVSTVKPEPTRKVIVKRVGFIKTR